MGRMKLLLSPQLQLSTWNSPGPWQPEQPVAVFNLAPGPLLSFHPSDSTCADYCSAQTVTIQLEHLKVVGSRPSASIGLPDRVQASIRPLPLRQTERTHKHDRDDDDDDISNCFPFVGKLVTITMEQVVVQPFRHRHGAGGERVRE